jgi:WD40 repeat protein
MEAWSVGSSPSGTRLAVSLENAVKILTVGDWETASELADGTGLKAVSAEGRYAALADGLYEARIVETASGDAGARVHAGATIEAIAFSPDGQSVAVAGLGKDVDLWQADAGGSDVLRVAAGSLVGALSFDADETSLMTASASSGVRRFPLEGERVAAPLVPSATGALAAFSADGRRLALAEGQQLAILDAADGNATRRFEYQGRATAVALSPEGSAVALATDDGYILLWPTAGAGHRYASASGHGRRGPPRGGPVGRRARSRHE